jgi:hypothetical protein
MMTRRMQSRTCFSNDKETTMKFRTSFISLAAIAAALPMFAHAAACKDTFPNGQCLYGEPAKEAAPAETVDLARTHAVDVQYGETVKFVNGGQSFTWTFDGADARGLELSQIAPSDVDTRMAKVYVGANPLLDQ